MSTPDPLAPLLEAIALRVRDLLIPELERLLGVDPTAKLEPRLTTDELAGILKVHPQSVRDWAKEGCPHLRVARGGLRFLLSEVEGWLRSRSQAEP